MRILEALCIVPLAIGALSLVWIGSASHWLIRASWVAAIVLILAQLYWIGPHWQIAPIYFAALLLAAVGIFGASYPRWSFWLCCVLTFVCVLAAGASSYVLPMFHLPRPTGDFPIGTTVAYLVDSSRTEIHTHPPGSRRELMVQVWYPAATSRAPLASYRRWRETTLVSSYMAVLSTHSRTDAPVSEQGGSFPVILFNPSWKGPRSQNTAQMEDLASHGLVVVAIDHTYNSQIIAFPDGRRMKSDDVPDIPEYDVPVAKQMADDDAEANYQAGDDIFVLNQLDTWNRDAKSRFYGKLDTSRSGAYGHSFGGAVSMEAARRDPRVRGAINLDGWVFGDVAAAGIPKPYLLISNDDPDPEPGQLDSLDKPARIYAEITLRDMANMRHTMDTYGGSILTIHGCNHVNFSDRAFYSPLRRLTYAGAIDPRRANMILETYILAFFTQTLKGSPQPILSGRENPFPEARLTVWKPKETLSH